MRRIAIIIIAAAASCVAAAAARGQVQFAAEPLVAPVDWNAAFDNAQPPCEGEVDEPWIEQWLPQGLLYRPYLAGEKEARLGHVLLHDADRGWISETALGGRMGLLRYGTVGGQPPQGWQFDVEGGVMLRLDPEEGSDLEAADFRGGGAFTYRNGPTACRLGSYHLSSHLGDEFMLKNPTVQRANYVRDAGVLGVSHDIADARLYGEAAFAPAAGGGAEPWEFQFGGDYSPAGGLPTGKAFFVGQPFFGVNIHLREEFDFGGSVNIMAGWQQRGFASGRVARLGMQYYNGKALQYSFFNQHEELLGLGVWLDY